MMKVVGYLSASFEADSHYAGDKGTVLHGFSTPQDPFQKLLIPHQNLYDSESLRVQFNSSFFFYLKVNVIHHRLDVKVLFTKVSPGALSTAFLV